MIWFAYAQRPEEVEFLGTIRAVTYHEAIAEARMRTTAECFAVTTDIEAIPQGKERLILCPYAQRVGREIYSLEDVPMECDRKGCRRSLTRQQRRSWLNLYMSGRSDWGPYCSAQCGAMARAQLFLKDRNYKRRKGAARKRRRKEGWQD